MHPPNIYSQPHRRNPLIQNCCCTHKRTVRYSTEDRHQRTQRLSAQRKAAQNRTRVFHTQRRVPFRRNAEKGTFKRASGESYGTLKYSVHIQVVLIAVHARFSSAKASKFHVDSTCPTAWLCQKPTFVSSLGSLNVLPRKHVCTRRRCST